MFFSRYPTIDLGDHKELFNYRHALLRNHIERIFGLFKRRFKILLTAQEYSLKTQAQLIPALAASANYGLSAQYYTDSVVVHSACSGCRDVYDFHRSTRVLLQCYHRLHAVF
jgi:hypothetical protein